MDANTSFLRWLRGENQFNRRTAAPAAHVAPFEPSRSLFAAFKQAKYVIQCYLGYATR
jgi:hypothetical protein